MKNRWLLVQQLSDVLSPLQQFTRQQIPVKGWIRTIRTVFGITQKQLADKVNVSKQSIASLEQREAEGTVTLKTLQDVAEAFDMQLVYAFVPKVGTLEEYVNEKAQKKATEIVLRTANTMKLEDQENSQKRLKRAIEERTCSGFNSSPSISADFKTSKVKVSSKASSRNSNPRDSILPNKRPCRFLASLKKLTNSSIFQVKFGQLSF